MTTIALGEATPQIALHRIRWAISDTLTITWRNLTAYLRMPEALFFSTVQPVMFVLLFRYVFGGALSHVIPGGQYVDYMVPGIMVQAVIFGAISTSIGLAEDLHKGLIERFRALPMARSAVLAGRTTADLIRNIFVVAVMTGVSYAVGFRIGTNVGEYLAGVGMILFLAYALSWLFAIIGLLAPSSEAAQVMGFPIILPLVFGSSAFVPTSQMPGWLQAWANHQPLSIVIDAARSLMVGGASFHHPFDVVKGLIWCAGMLAVFIPLSVWRYRRAGE